MSDCLSIATRIEAELAARCQELGLPLGRLDGSNRIVWLTAVPEPIQTLCVLPQFQCAFNESKGEDSDNDCRLIEITPELFTLVLEQCSCDRSGLLTFACVQPTQFSAAFGSLCAAAGISEQVFIDAIGPKPSTDAIRELASMLAWVPRSIRQNQEQLDTLAEEFGTHLAASYEQISSMYRLVRSLNSVDDPPRIVSLACAQLMQTLGFEWFAACFSKREEVSRALSGQFLPVGELPVVESVIAEYANDLVAQHVSDRWTVVLDPAHEEFAARVGSEVLVELIAHDGVSIGALLAGGRTGHDADITSSDMQLVDAAADYLGVFHQNVCRFDEQRELFFGTLSALSGSIDAKDPYTRGHSDRVARLSYELAVAVRLSEEEAETIRISGQLHDVGKIGVPESILLKPGKLTDAEFELLKRHPVIGYEILHDIRLLKPMLPGVLHHHERWDGNGYPERIAGTDIPLMARILGLADSFDAMSSDRAYRAARSRGEVLAEIERCSGSQFDPDLARVFLELDLCFFDEMLAADSERSARAA